MKLERKNMLIETNKIIVNDRIRKDFGDIEELANDIKENGLINPPVVTPEYELIAGERRLRALKYLDYKQIEVRIMSVKDSEHQLQIEISENENRKDFTFSERVDWAKRLERIESIKAKNRMSEGGQGVQISSPLSKTREIVADKSGFGSHDTYNKAKYVSENATDDMIRELDEGKLSINKAFLTLKQEKQSLENQLQQERNKQPKVIDNTDYTSIDTLKSKIERLEKDKQLLERKAKLNQDEADKYVKLKSDIDFLTKQKSDLSRQIESSTELASLSVRLQNTLEKDLAPIKFKRCMETLDNSDIAVENLENIINSIETWIDEIKNYLPNGNVIQINNYDEI